MVGLIGIIVIFVTVFGGYMLAGGKMGIILQALPFEMIMIGGAAVGAFVLSNDHSLHSTHALQQIADGLPALGIVAAVLGVIKTMGSIDQPPEILGKMIGGALVGTFLGVFLAYGLVGPFAARVKTVIEEDGHFQQLIREVLVANLHQHAPNICIEVGRQNTPASCRPSFTDLEDALKSTKQEAA